MKLYMFLLCFHCAIMRADFTSSILDNTLSLAYVGTGYLFEPPTNCSLLLDSFADYAANFTRCSIKHARPIRLCEECVDNYVSFRDKYEELLTTKVNGSTCKSFFFSHDRLDAVHEYHDNILAIWNKGNCNGCFNWNQTTPVLSDSTKNFTRMYKETISCIDENYPTCNNTEEVCQKCMTSYIQLDEYYKSLSSDSIGVDSICMDIVDSMNATRSIWSKSLGCCKLRKSPEVIFLACSGIIAFLPVLYYIAVMYCGPIRDLPNVLKQSRFKQRLLRTGNGRIN